MLQIRETLHRFCRRFNLRIGFRAGHSTHVRHSRKPRAKTVKQKILLAVFALLSAISIGFYVFDAGIAPLSDAFAIKEAHEQALSAINAAVASVIYGDELKYDDIISFEKDSDGGILALKTNIVLINSLKTRISKGISENIAKYNEAVTEIPLGSIIGGEFFSGKGPKLIIKMLPLGYADTEYVNRFTAAGINQTRHQILLDISVKIRVMLSGRSREVDVKTDIVIAETIIVGKVPSNYTIIGGGTMDSVKNGVIYSKKAIIDVE